jgi:hypothetical protein
MNELLMVEAIFSFYLLMYGGFCFYFSLKAMRTALAISPQACGYPIFVLKAISSHIGYKSLVKNSIGQFRHQPKY